MIFGVKNRRRKKRYPVSWNAILEVQFSSFIGQLPVNVINFSGFGALIRSERIDIDRHHLIVTNEPPNLKLIICLPEWKLDLKSKIQWYSWSIEATAFDIGIKFTDLSAEEQDRIDLLIKLLKNKKINMMN